MIPELTEQDPNARGFSDEVNEMFKFIIDLVGGRTLGLFTSHKAVRRVYEYVRETNVCPLICGDPSPDRQAP